MFKSRGKTRTQLHNLKIASLLSFVAGMVNVAGFLAVKQLTTNVTGHFAFFVDEIFQFKPLAAFVYFLYILFFFLGSFTSSLMVELISKRSEKLIYVAPLLFESVLLGLVAVFGGKFMISHPNILACILLFSMGLQNSLVTSISNATVRTTHLTGLFTDLGIELSQLFFYKLPQERAPLLASIKLRFSIIAFFFIGGALSGILFGFLKLYVLFIGAASLILAILYDELKVRTLQNLSKTA